MFQEATVGTLILSQEEMILIYSSPIKNKQIDSRSSEHSNLIHKTKINSQYDDSEIKVKVQNYRMSVADRMMDFVAIDVLLLSIRYYYLFILRDTYYVYPSSG